MRGVPTGGGSEAYLVRTSQRRASAPGTHPEDGCRRWAFFSSLLTDSLVEARFGDQQGPCVFGNGGGGAMDAQWWHLHPRTGRLRWWGTGMALALVLVSSVARAASEPTRGGVLNATLEESPPSFSIHEEATLATVWAIMPCYNNLTLFDPFQKQENLNTIIGELAEKWEWQDGGKALVFTLRRGVKWHDGQPFSGKDVKYTFDVVREAPGAPAKLRVNPRKLWYENVAGIETPDPETVIFRLKRPQPSLLLMLASGYSPVYPAHVPPAELRTKCMGTGPFKLKEYRPGESVELVRNTDYFIRGRPYLDGIRYVIIQERGTRYAAIQANRLDIAYPQEISKLTRSGRSGSTRFWSRCRPAYGTPN